MYTCLADATAPAADILDCLPTTPTSKGCVCNNTNSFTTLHTPTCLTCPVMGSCICCLWLLRLARRPPNPKLTLTGRFSQLGGLFSGRPSAAAAQGQQAQQHVLKVSTCEPEAQAPVAFQAALANHIWGEGLRLLPPH